ncbi:DUF6241 domain-containing protein [Halobacillus dabanensis]|nr:DUF6241 domain-containing protein [Halobacillus dabanensis]
MGKILNWSLYALGALSLIVIGVIAWGVISGLHSAESITEEQEQKMQEVNKPTEQKEIVKVHEDGIPTEETFQQQIHNMTHQKVIAAEKWGKQQITPEQIDRLLGILKTIEETERHYEHFDFYKKTLEAWDGGNFSNSVMVHNTIWEWQNGSVGKATGLLSEEEERQYIENNF